MKRFILLALFTVSVAAQEPVIDHYEVGIFRKLVSLETPFVLTVITPQFYTCGHRKQDDAPDAVPNPTGFAWNDPADENLECRIDAKMLVLNLPLGTNYIAGVRACSKAFDIITGTTADTCSPWAFTKTTFRRAPVGEPCEGGTGTQSKVFIDLPSGPATVTLCVQR